jgi:hypothetical protein
MFYLIFCRLMFIVSSTPNVDSVSEIRFSGQGRIGPSVNQNPECHILFHKRGIAMTFATNL